MANCNCCGCTETPNYRSHNTAPAGVTFAQWCNADREFVLTDSPTDDAGGPWSLTTGGGWVALDGYTLGPPPIAGGTLTLNGVFGHAYSCQLFSGGRAPNGSGIIAAWGHELSAVGEVSIPSSEWAFGFLSSAAYTTRISFDGNSLLKLLGGFTLPQPYVLERYSSTGRGDDSEVSGLITARSLRGGLSSLQIFPGSQITHAFSVAPVTPQAGRLFEGYANGPVQLQGAKCSLYRNGTLIWQATRPQPSDSETHTAEDGVYLWVSEVVEAADPPYTGSGIDARTRLPSPLKRMQSFAVDTTPPVIGVTPPCDFFVDTWNDVSGQRPYIVSTKPIRFMTAGVPQQPLVADVVGGEHVVRPLYVPRQGSAPTMDWYSDSDQAYTGNLPVGLYAVKAKLFAAGAFTVRDLSTYRDYAGNSPASVPTFSLRVHAVPANDRRGARPVLEDVGLQTCEYGRARLQSEQVASVRLRFDRVVDPATVTASQVTLTKDGTPVSGCTIQQLNATDWRITLPNPAGQTPKSFWVLTYDPAGEVLTDDIDEVEYTTYDDFPPAADSVYRRAYVATDTGKRYSKSPAGYVEIEDGPPVDENGVPFEPEPCVLAYRISWLMASANGWLVPQDTSSVTRLIGDTMSMSKAVSSLPPLDGTFRIQSTGGYIFDWGETRSGTYVDGFTPCVPPQSAPTGTSMPTDFSYWGLTTTIDPAPPATLRCPVAKTAQRHASVVRRVSDLESFKIARFRRDSITGVEVADVPPLGVSSFEQVTVSKTAYGENLPQNCWYASLPEATGFQEFEVPNFAALNFTGGWGLVYKTLDTGARYSRANNSGNQWNWVSIGSGNPIDPDGNEYDPPGAINREIWLAASRSVSEYAALQTTTLWELEIEAYYPLQIRSIDQVTGAVSISTSRSRSRIVLSKDKEDAWNAGEEFVVKVDGTDAWWRFSP